MSSADRIVKRILLDGAREAYVGDERRLIPIDTACPTCGVDRESCDRPLCSRLLSEAES